jgi:hypothetical protein
MELSGATCNIRLTTQWPSFQNSCRSIVIKFGALKTENVILCLVKENPNCNCEDQLSMTQKQCQNYIFSKGMESLNAILPQLLIGTGRILTHR